MLITNLCDVIILSNQTHQIQNKTLILMEQELTTLTNPQLVASRGWNISTARRILTIVFGRKLAHLIKRLA